MTGRILDRTGRESHPAADLFPMMGEAELRALADDIKARGLQHPITLCGESPETGAPLVLDGRNRLVACEMVGIAPEFEWFDKYSERDPIAWVLSQNLHRRHLTDTQRKMVAAEAAKMYEAEARERMLAGRSDPSADRRQGKASEKAARDLGVSPREVEKAKRVAERAPVLKDAVLSGAASLDAAAALADEPEACQRALVAEGPEAIKRAAKAKRQERRQERDDATGERDDSTADAPGDSAPAVLRGGSALEVDPTVPAEIVTFSAPEPDAAPAFPSDREALLDRALRCVRYLRQDALRLDHLVLQLGYVLEDVDAGCDSFIRQLESEMPEGWDEPLPAE